MAAKLSKEVTTRMRSCLFVISALWQQGQMVANRVLEIVQPHLLEGDEPPAFFAQIVALMRTLQAALDRLLAIDRKLYDVQDEQAGLRRVRDKALELLGKQISGLRQCVAGQYTAPELEGLGLREPKARDSFALLRQADLIGHKSTREDLERTLGDAVFEDAFDPRANAEQIQETSRFLRSTLEQINVAQRKIDELVINKEEIMKEHDGVFLRVARHFEELCHLAGQDKLAAKVRASSVRQGRAAQDLEAGDDEPSAATEAADGEVAVDASTAGAEPAPEDGGPAVVETATA